MTTNRTRKELYARVRELGREQFILEEMVRLGFWGRDADVPSDPAAEVAERGRIIRELNALRAESSQLANHTRMLRELRKQRMAESRRRRAERRAERERERLERAARWRARLQSELPFLGREVSGGLNHTTSDLDALRLLGLPPLATPRELADAMQLPLGELRFLAWNRRVSHRTHYVRFRIPKRSGGERTISAPMPRLKAAQHWILAHILTPLDGALHHAAHGFRPQRSILTNAAPHVGRDVVVNLDLQDFFPTITWRRLRGLFRKLGYSEAVATVLALLCTEAPLDQVELDGRTWFVQRGPRALPQGAPTSPALTNLLCRRLDRRLSGMARHHGFRYTRYADDLTFSADGDAARKRVGALLRGVRLVIEAEGFVVHPDKTTVRRRGRRQEVTGLVVNQRPSVDRRAVRRLRALVFQLERDGLDGKHWQGRTGDALLPAILGFAEFVTMVDPARGRPLRERILALRERYPGPLTPRATAAPRTEARPAPDAVANPAPETPTPTPTAAPDGDSTPPAQKKKKWWKVF